MLVKRYSNRRLYDTSESRYITLLDLADKIRGGQDPQVVDAKTGQDLTQATLAQIILESRGAARLLPIPLLTRMIRLGDAALAEFLGRYMTVALEMYLQAKRGAQAMGPYNPFATLPFDAGSNFARMFMGAFPFGEGHGEGPSSQRTTEAPNEIAELRREVEELKQAIHRKKGR